MKLLWNFAISYESYYKTCFMAAALIGSTFIGSSLSRAEEKQTLSLQNIFEAVEASHRSGALDKAAAKAAASGIESTHANFSSWNLELESALDLNKSKDSDEKERNVKAFVERSFYLGVNDEAIRQQFQSEAQALTLEADEILTEQQTVAGQAFIQLLHHQRIIKAADRILSALDPLIKGVEQAGLRGNADALSLLKWKILRQELLAARTESISNYVMIADELQQGFGIKAPAYDQNSVLIEPNFNLDRQLDPHTFRKVKALQAQANSLANKSRVLVDAFEFSAGVGVEHAVSSETNSIVARVSIPLSQWNKNRATQTEAAAQKSLIETKAAMTGEAVKRYAANIQRKLRGGISQAKVQETRRVELEKLFKSTLSNFRKGLADLSQIIETSEKLFELEVNLSQTIRETQGEGVELLSLTGEKQ